jgi:hypothetical protein
MIVNELRKMEEWDLPLEEKKICEDEKKKIKREE